VAKAGSARLLWQAAHAARDESTPSGSIHVKTTTIVGWCLPFCARNLLLAERQCCPFLKTLGEIKLFLNGLRDTAPVGLRWRKLARQKIKEVDQTIERSRRLKSLFEHLLHCHCASLQLCVERLSLSPSLRLIPDRTNQRRLAKERRA
jgi:hypothetical protein